jgi:hypothetical protein
MIDARDYLTCANDARAVRIVPMELVFLLFLVLVGLLSLRYGVDSRRAESHR